MFLSGTEAVGALWRGLAWLATSLGYVFGTVKRWSLTRSRTRPAAIGPLEFLLPIEWGEFVASAEGDFFVSSRPLAQVLDGDTNWYSTIAEIRVRPVGARSLAALAPMVEMDKFLDTEYGQLAIVLRLANGVGQRKRTESTRAFASVRITNAAPMIWPHHPDRPPQPPGQTN